jgi:hypothetical protein
MQILKSLYRFLSPKFQSLHLDYHVDSKPRYGHGLPPNKPLFDIINKNKAHYSSWLERFLKYSNTLAEIKPGGIEKDENQPSWNNGFLPGLDIVGIYGMIAENKPAQYIEVGSGNSTKVARKAIADLSLNTKITSIDPFPRANIDHLADKIIRKPFENVPDYSFITETLEENDILFIDNSHRSFPNSDVTVCFLEVIPKLKEGVIVQIHDIYLPYDYPQFMCDRFYNEQYLLATLILANPEKYQPILPNYFISEDKELSRILEPFWQQPNLKGVEKHGGSFWFRIGR